jgi:hypothetical protein
MIKAKAKDKRHPKIINQYMVYQGINEINTVFGAIIAFKAYLNSTEFNKYHAELAIDCLRNTLCEGTVKIEEWLEIGEENKNVES